MNVRMTWKAVVGYEGFYKISNLGQVKRTKRGQGARLKILKPQRAGEKTKPYLAVGLCRSGKARITLVHRMVVEAFIRPMEPGEQVNHIDGDRFNNSVDNLEIVNARGNMMHAIDTLGWRPNQNPEKGEDRYNAKLSDKSVAYIRTHTKKYGIATKLARELGVSGAVVSKVLNGRSWKHVNAQFPVF